MSLAGFKKQFNKANQYMNEKIGGAKGTELDEEFTEMERKIDVTGKLVADLVNKTHEYLQPNPASRAKLTTLHTISKVRGQSKQAMYPQPEGTLGECMVKHGKDLGDENAFGSCLVEAGESFKQLAEVKYSLEDAVKQNFIEPLTHLQSKDIKEINHHRKKTESRRLDYDCKRRKKEKGGSNITDEEIDRAEEKFEESKALAETAMNNLLENDVEQISQLAALVEAQLDFNKRAMDILQPLYEQIQERRSDAACRPKSEHVPKRVASVRHSTKDNDYDNSLDSLDLGGKTTGGYEPTPIPQSKPSREPSCEAIYDFDPENEGELGFQEGDIIKLTSQIDENWYEGELHGQKGFFPTNYVTIVVPL